MLPRALLAGLLILALPAAAGARDGISPRHQLAQGVEVEPGSVAFFSDLHIGYGSKNRDARPSGRKNMVAIADLLRNTPAVSGVVFGGDYYHAPNLNGLSERQKSAALVRGLTGLKQRLGAKPLEVLFGNHDIPLSPAGDARGFEPGSVREMARTLGNKGIRVIGTDYDKTYRLELPGGAVLKVSHAPKASSRAISAAMEQMSFDAETHTVRARAKMREQPRRRKGEWVSADSHVVAFDRTSRGKTSATIVNLGTAGSPSRPIGDPFTVAIRQPTRGWLFLKQTPKGFVPYDPSRRGSPPRTSSAP